MGVDCTVRLPQCALAEDIATVVAAAAGLPITLEPLQSGGVGGVYASTKGMTLQPSNSSGMAIVVLLGPMVDGETHHTCYLHLQSAYGRRGSRDWDTACSPLLSMSCTPFWASVADRVVDFFGGTVDYNDCDTKDVNRRVAPKPVKLLLACNGEAWEAKQRALAAVKPITKADLKRHAEVRS